MKQVVLMLLLSVLTFSCIKDVDFSQYQQFISDPIPFSLALFRHKATRQSDVLQHNYYDMDINGIFVENTNPKIYFTTSFTNSFDTAITCSFDFYNKDAVYLFSTPEITIPPHTFASSHFKQELIFINGEYYAFIEAKKADIRLQLQGLPNVADTGIFQLQTVISADLVIEQKPGE